ncbi:hypothetical protein VTK56DRAFT_7598 [Thermocarpiscus australiensis]
MSGSSRPGLRQRTSIRRPGRYQEDLGPITADRPTMVHPTVPFNQELSRHAAFPSLPLNHPGLGPLEARRAQLAAAATATAVTQRTAEDSDQDSDGEEEGAGQHRHVSSRVNGRANGVNGYNTDTEDDGENDDDGDDNDDNGTLVDDDDTDDADNSDDVDGAGVYMNGVTTPNGMPQQPSATLPDNEEDTVPIANGIVNGIANGIANGNNRHAGYVRPLCLTCRVMSKSAAMLTPASPQLIPTAKRTLSSPAETSQTRTRSSSAIAAMEHCPSL